MSSEQVILKLRALTNFPAIVGYLSRDLDWPLEAENIVEEDLRDLTFDYTPAELGIDEQYSAKITRIRQLRNLVDGQPWGIFYVEFESRRLPVTVLRRVLNKLVRATEDRPGWNMEDLLFICVQGAPGERGVAFAHFRREDDTRLPELRTFSWDSRESHFFYIRNLNLEKLRWPDDEDDHDAWRAQWRSAFTTRHHAVITTSQTLASAMAAQAREIREIIEDLYDIESRDGALHKLYERFRKALLHDLTPGAFADVVAQTITYGLFSAAEQSADITFEQVVEFIPKTNPFLKELLQALTTDYDIDLTELGVDRLIDMLRDADVPAIARNFMRQTGSGAEDPVIHFYEQFLNEYDREQRVQRGVFYTPNPVVSYIVRSVDHLLKTEFGIADGLASADKAVNPKTGRPEHVVQVLDPATGTGTFLQYIIDEIARQKNPRGASTDEWNRYVAEDLLPRLNGFELMMAPYTVAHMKLGLKLEQTGYQFESNQRLCVYLTNALDKPVRMQDVLLETDYLSKESNEAAGVKLTRPIMVVIGNPPYSGHSANQLEDDWIGLGDYYQVDGKPLGERNPKWLQDDYVKFIRFGQHRIEQTGAGILAFITNHGYLDNPTFRGMRQSLLHTFDEIYVLDLHGNAKKKETAPGGGKDENVFDIMQGVAIGIFVKYPAGSGKARDVAEVHHHDLFGVRDQKYKTLLDGHFDRGVYEPGSARKPFYLLIPQDTAVLAEYQHGWKITDAIVINSLGIATARDALTIGFTKEEIHSRILDFSRLPESEAREKYQLGSDARDWKVVLAQGDLKQHLPLGFEEYATSILYRPFDTRYTFYTGQTRGFMCMPRQEVMQHMMHRDNLALITARNVEIERQYDQVFCTNTVTQLHTLSIKEVNYHLPLYTYPDPNQLFDSSPYPLSEKRRHPNLDPAFVADVEQRLNLHFITEGCGDLVNTFGPEDVFHYAYAVFHSPTYRERYAEFLKGDFPRLPLTTDLVLFNRLAQQGADLVALHLLEDDYAAASWNLDGDESPLADTGVTFHEGQDGRTMGKFSGNNYMPPVTDGMFPQPGRVYLDSSKKDDISYFEGIEADVWNFQIGGYQVLHKWLYDRRETRSQTGRTLTDEDIHHYPRIVAALRATMRIMQEIDQAIEHHGGWPLRGSQPDEVSEDDVVQEQLAKVIEERYTVDRNVPGLAYDEETEEELPQELTQEVLNTALSRASGVEEEREDPDLDGREEIQPFDPTLINIQPLTLTAQQLMTRIQDFDETNGELGLNLRPDFQRMGGIWSDEAQSRLIESMMIRIPLPAFYMNEDSEHEDAWLVIDGLQRLTAMRRFMMDQSLRLKKLEFWKEYEGKTFDDLPRTLQRRLEETQTSIYLVKKGTPHNVKFNIFKRINTGGVPLSGQEIRHALNLGASTELLKQLASEEEYCFKLATDGGVGPMRMTDRECVLRFLAFMDKDSELQEQYGMRNYQGYSSRDDLDTFLNESMRQINILGRDDNPDRHYIEDFRQRFKRAMIASRQIFDNRAFRKPTDSARRSQVSKALFEVWSVNLDRCTDEEVETLVERSSVLENWFQLLMDDTEFVIAISYSTGDPRRVQYRFDKIREIIQDTLTHV